MDRKHVLLLGGYGGTGRALARRLLLHLPCSLTIAGRSGQKAGQCCEALLNDFPHANVSPLQLDARDKASLIAALAAADLVVVTATIPDHIHVVAEAALETGTDAADILIRGDIVDNLAPYSALLQDAGLTYITQCGFHPGLIAPMVHFARMHFSEIREARALLAMDPVFENRGAVNEILHEVAKGNGEVLDSGRWRRATYKDAEKVTFPEYFGHRTCYPLHMREMRGLEASIGLEFAGTYAAGFGGYVDNVVFPIVMAIGKINRSVALDIGSRLFLHAVKKKSLSAPRVECILVADGEKEGQQKRLQLQLAASDGYDLTACAVVACLKQYFDGSLDRPGLHLMGKASNPGRLFEQLQMMGYPIKTTFQN